MAQIYATQGDISKMTEDMREWLTNPQNADTRLEQQLGEVLKREASTRIFDNYFVGQIHPQGSKIGILSNLIGAYMNTNRIYKVFLQQKQKWKQTLSGGCQKFLDTIQM